MLSLRATVAAGHFLQIGTWTNVTKRWYRTICCNRQWNCVLILEWRTEGGWFKGQLYLYKILYFICILYMFIHPKSLCFFSLFFVHRGRKAYLSTSISEPLLNGNWFYFGGFLHFSFSFSFSLFAFLFSSITVLFFFWPVHRSRTISMKYRVTILMCKVAFFIYVWMFLLPTW